MTEHIMGELLGPNLKCARAGRSMQWETQYFDVRAVWGQGQRRPHNNLAVSKVSGSTLTLEMAPKRRESGRLLLKIFGFNVIEEFPKLTNLTFLRLVVGDARRTLMAVSVIPNHHAGLLDQLFARP